MAVGSLIDILWTNRGKFLLSKLSQKRTDFSLVVEKYSLRMHKDPFVAHLVQKSIIICVKGNLVLQLIQIFEFDGDVHFLVVDP